MPTDCDRRRPLSQLVAKHNGGAMNGRSLAVPTEGQKRLLILGAFADALLVGHPALALLAGTGASLALAPTLPSYVGRGGKLCLQAAIVLLGFTLNVQALWQTSRDYAALIVVFVVGTLIAGLVIGRLVRADEDQSRLLSAGTAICGGTAIVTLAPIIRARPESVALAIGIVFLLNAPLLHVPWHPGTRSSTICRTCGSRTPWERDEQVCVPAGCLDTEDLRPLGRGQKEEARCHLWATRHGQNWSRPAATRGLPTWRRSDGTNRKPSAFTT